MLATGSAAFGLPASERLRGASRVSFLASPQASYITGTTVAADGGRRAI
ncbi:MAG TPA: hypothetical protein VGX26_11005 [Solirubrobacteraceae bacterium]|nr:hypothetical protein [Solirubrobacteraceae bacterium]